MRQKCRRLVRAHGEGAITDEELLSNLYEVFIHAGERGFQRCFPASIDALPADVVVALTAYVKANPEPRLFRPLAETEGLREAAERRALAVQIELLERLAEWVPPGK